ncbi:hypothetical protein BC629DRAFT_1538147, partial [Irpex lacteus]
DEIYQTDHWMESDGHNIQSVMNWTKLWKRKFDVARAELRENACVQGAERVVDIAPIDLVQSTSNYIEESVPGRCAEQPEEREFLPESGRDISLSARIPVEFAIDFGVAEADAIMSIYDDGSIERRSLSRNSPLPWHENQVSGDQSDLSSVVLNVPLAEQLESSGRPRRESDQAPEDERSIYAQLQAPDYDT